MEFYITNDNLYIKQLFNIIKSSNCSTSLEVRNNRHCDAFIYILSGSCLYTLDDGKCLIASAGSILYLAHTASYTMLIQEHPYTFIYCDFLFDDIRSRKSSVYFPKNTTEVQNLFSKLYNLNTGNKDNSFTASMSVLYKIYGIICSSCKNNYVSVEARQKLADAKLYIDNNFCSQDISISSIAEKFQISEVHFRNLFKSINGTTPVQYLTSVRLEHAKQLMKYPFLTLSECAEQSGFSALQYFCKVFKHTYGITASAYRKNIYKITP